jgi:hypothetical protein
MTKKITKDGVVLQLNPPAHLKFGQRIHSAPDTKQLSHTTSPLQGSQPHLRQKSDNVGKGANNRIVAWGYYDYGSEVSAPSWPVYPFSNWTIADVPGGVPGIMTNSRTGADQILSLHRGREVQCAHTSIFRQSDFCFLKFTWPCLASTNFHLK